MLEQSELKTLFDHDPETGWFTNRFSRGRAKVGERASSFTDGYRRIIIHYKKYYEHHLAWFYVHGTWPYEIDHANGDPSDNRISNLRSCTRSQNKFNAQTATGEAGLSGAYLDKRTLQWYSKIQVGGQQVYLGIFASPEAAHQAYLKAQVRYAGEFALHLRS